MKPIWTLLMVLVCAFVGFSQTVRNTGLTAEAKALIARYIAKAGEQETRIEQIETERKAAQAEKERLERELAIEIKNFEVK